MAQKATTRSGGNTGLALALDTCTGVEASHGQHTGIARAGRIYGERGDVGRARGKCGRIGIAGRAT